jgi:hypothetical protein
MSIAAEKSGKLQALARSEVLECLPCFFGRDKADPMPVDLAGAVIVKFGMLAEADVEGGLVLDYRERNSDVVKRLVFGFNELAMWVEFSGDRE